MIYYKVVTLKLESAYVYRTYDRDQYCVKYEVGNFVYPKVDKTYLMAFDSFDNARNFSEYSGTFHKIFTCELLDPISPLFKNIGRSDYFDEIWQCFHKNVIKEQFSNLPLLTNFPTGTVWAKAIKLIEEVEC